MPRKLHTMLGLSRVRLHPLAPFLVGIFLAILACGMIVSIGRSFRLSRQAAITIAAELPSIRAKVALLRAITDAEESFAATGMTSRAELAEAYILPARSPSPRLASSLSDIAAALTRAGIPLHIDRLHIGDASDAGGNLRTYDATLSVIADEEAIARFIHLIEIGSTMMVHDVLESSVRDTVRRMTEEASPSSLPALERFFLTDILTYAIESDAREMAVVEKMPASTRDAVRAALLRGGLASVRSALHDIAAPLRTKASWPMPMMALRSIHRDGSRFLLNLTVFGYAEKP